MGIGNVFNNALSQLIGRDAIVFAVAAMGINVHFGYTGLLNFGQVGWMAVGSYGMAIGVLSLDLSLWLAIPFGLLCSVVLSLLLGLPTLRLRADYLAIVTVATGELIRIVGRAAALSDVTGGSSGLPGRNPQGFNRAFYALNPFERGTYGFGPFRYNDRQLWFMIVGWTVVFAVVGLVWLMMRSPWGRVLRAIREDEDAVRSLGKSAYKYKMQSLIIGGLFGSVAGMLLALESGAVQPDTYSTPVTFFAWTCLIIGGVARIWGPVIGAMIFWFLLSFTEGLLLLLRNEGALTFLSTTQIGQVRFVILGLSLALLMVFRPQGIFGSREEMALHDR